MLYVKWEHSLSATYTGLSRKPDTIFSHVESYLEASHHLQKQCSAKEKFTRKWVSQACVCISRTASSWASSVPACMGPSHSGSLSQEIWLLSPNVFSQRASQKLFLNISVKQDSKLVWAIEKLSKSSPYPESFCCWIHMYLTRNQLLHSLTLTFSKRHYKAPGPKTMVSVTPFASDLLGKLGQVIISLSALPSTSTRQIWSTQTSVTRNVNNYYSYQCMFKIGYFLLSKQYQIWLSLNVILSPKSWYL